MSNDSVKHGGAPASGQAWPQPHELLPTTPPDIDTGISRAWQMQLDRVMKDAPAAKRELNVGAWLVYAPWAHPIWHSYMIAVISLRDIAGWPPAEIGFAGVTHELLVIALDPAPAPGRVYALDAPLPYLQPTNFCGQFRCDADGVARVILAETVHDVAEALLNPDTDARSAWEARYGQANIRSIDKSHLRWESRVHPRNPAARWDAPVHFQVAPGGHA